MPSQNVLSKSELVRLQLHNIHLGSPEDVIAKHGLVTIRVCTLQRVWVLASSVGPIITIPPPPSP